MRICDAQATASESEALAALMVACIAQAVRDEDEGLPLQAPAPRLIEENMWRAIRFGMDGRLIDLERAEEFPARAALERLAAWTEPVRSELGIELSLPGAQRRPAPAPDDRRGSQPRGGLRGVRPGDQAELQGGGGGLSTPEDFAGAPAPGDPSEEELRAAYEAELSRITTTDMIAQATISLLNLGARKLAPAAEGAPEGGGGQDLEQVRDAIDATRALMDVLERRIPQEVPPLRDALSRLQMAYAQEIQRAPGAASSPAAKEPPGGARRRSLEPGGSGRCGRRLERGPSAGRAAPGGLRGARPGPAESSGRLWVPGN